MINYYCSSKTIVKSSTKTGEGLFASENLLAEKIIAFRAGHIVNITEVLRLDKKMIKWKKIKI
jgi:hypothetical protein